MPIVGERWEIYASEEEDGRRVVTFDLDLANQTVRQSSVCHRVLLRFPAPHVLPSGMPKPEAAVPMRLAEEALIGALEKADVRCRLAARTTYAGHREFAFQVEDETAFMPIVDAWRKMQTWETRVVCHDGWEYFDDAILPTPAQWEQIRTRSKVTALLEGGTDPAAIHEFAHVFLGPEDALAHIAADLSDDGFRPSAQGGARLVLVQDAALDIDEITTTTQMLAIVATEHGAIYDGWTAAIVPLPACP